MVRSFGLSDGVGGCSAVLFLRFPLFRLSLDFRVAALFIFLNSTPLDL